MIQSVGGTKRIAVAGVALGPAKVYGSPGPATATATIRITATILPTPHRRPAPSSPRVLLDWCGNPRVAGRRRLPLEPGAGGFPTSADPS